MTAEQGEHDPSVTRTGRKSEAMKNVLHGATGRYLTAVAVPVLAFVWRLAMVRHFGHDLPPYITLYPAVMLVAIVAGMGPGLLATAVSALLIDYWVLPPYGFGVANAADVFGLVLFFGMGAFVSIVAERYRRIRKKAAEYEKQLALRRVEEKYRTLVELSPEATFVNRKNRVEFANPAACRLFGVEGPEQLFGKEPRELFRSEFHPKLHERVRTVLEGGRVPLIEEKIVRLDGTLRDVEVVASRFTDEKGLAIQVILRDITERKHREEQLRKLYRTLKALNNSNQALLHATDEAALLQEVCKIITEDCGHAMVWIGFAENDEAKSVRPVAYAGFEEGYLETLGITWADDERGRGPTGTAIRSGQPSACRNMLTDPQFEPWRAQAVKRGYASSLGVPIMADGKAFGALTIYSREPETFSDDEIELLVELAGDLSHGITLLRMRAAHEQAQRETNESREWLRVTLTSIGDAVMTSDAEGRVTFLNPVAEGLTGWKTEEALGQPIQSVFRIVNEHTGEAAEDIVGRVLRERHIVALANHTALVTKDGKQTPIEDSAAPITDAAGNIDGVVLVFHDVTERRASQEALQESERRVRLKLDSILDPEGDVGTLELADIIDVPALQALMDEFYRLAHIPMAIIDMKGGVLVGVGWQDICTQFHRANPESCKHCLESDLELSAGVKPGEFKLYRCKNSMWDVVTPIMIGGKHVGNLFSGQFFFEGESPDREAFRLQGRKYGFDEAGYLAALDRVPRLSPDELAAGMSYFIKLADMISKLSYGNIKLARSLTERDALADSVRSSEERLRITLTSIGDAVMTSDAEGRMTFLNPVAEALTGWTMKEAVGQPIQSVFRIVNEETGKPAADIAGQVLRDRRIVALANHTALVTKDGRQIPIEDSAAPITDAAGNISGVVLVFHDVTERRAAQETLRQNEEKLRFHFENTPLAVVEWGPDFRLSKWSGEAERIFGWRAEEILGKRLDEFRWVHDEDVKKVAEIAGGLLDGSRPRSVGQNRNYRKDGSVVHCEWYNSSLMDDSGKLASILSLVLDVTDRKQAEEALIRNEKLASVGRMAATIAHEINNPLAAVMNALYLAKTTGEIPADVRHYVDIADEELKRVSHITRQALGFYRESSMAAEVSVSEILDSAVDVLQSRIKGKGAVVERQYADDIRITAVGGELRQVFSNLLLNGLEAGCEKCKITLRTSKCRIKESGQPAVRITVADNGKGIDAELRSRVFEPLFTTKGATGTGLGLWVTKQIVEKHGGSVRFRSRTTGERTGTVFSVVIPARTEGALSKAMASG